MYLSSLTSSVVLSSFAGGTGWPSTSRAIITQVPWSFSSSFLASSLPSAVNSRPAASAARSIVLMAHLAIGWGWVGSRDARRGAGAPRPAARRGYPTFSLLPGLAESLGHVVPVDHVPPGIHVIGPLVLVLQVVGVLPDVDAEHRHLVVHVGAVLVGGAQDLELAAGLHQPGPAAAEAAQRRLLQLLLEHGEVAEGR